MTRQAAVKGGGPRLFRYIGETVSELKKVVWLNRREVAYLTVLVLVVSATFGIILGTLDYGLSGLINQFFLR